MASRIPNGGGTVKLHYQGMRELLKSKEVASMLTERMARVQSVLPGSTMETRQRSTRVAAVVARGSDFDEANTGALSRALDMAGGLRGTRVTNEKRSRRK